MIIFSSDTMALACTNFVRFDHISRVRSNRFNNGSGEILTLEDKGLKKEGFVAEITRQNVVETKL